MACSSSRPWPAPAARLRLSARFHAPVSRSRPRRASSWSSPARPTTRPTTWQRSAASTATAPLPRGRPCSRPGRPRSAPATSSTSATRATMRPRQGSAPSAATMYGTRPNPGGLHEAYHRLVCGDWWDEDPYSSRYNQFVHVACGTTPPFAAWSEPLWTETQGDRGYPYLAVIDYNDQPDHRRAGSTRLGHLPARLDGRANTRGASPCLSPSCCRVLRWLEPSRSSRHRDRHGCRARPRATFADLRQLRYRPGRRRPTPAPRRPAPFRT